MPLGGSWGALGVLGGPPGGQGAMDLIAYGCSRRCLGVTFDVI